jgi:acyl-CoA thioester hydrolase
MTDDAALQRSGRMENGWHVLPMRVYWEDTDAAGIVYYANYLKFIERGRSDMLRLLGIGQTQLREEEGVMFAVRDCALSYLKPARLDDEIEVCTRILAVGGATLDAEQIVRRPGGEDLVTSQIRLACISPGGKPRRVPQMVRQTFAHLLKSSSERQKGEG